MTGEVKPQDADSGLVEREWTRTTKRGGTLTERTLERQHVHARFIDDGGRLQEVSGPVARNEAGTLIVEHWADGELRETPVGRESVVDVIGRKPAKPGFTR